MKYYIKQKVFSFTSQFDITDERQEPLYHVSGHFMSLTNKLELLNNRGEIVLRSNRQLFTFLPKYWVYSNNGEVLATMKKVFSIRPNFDINFKNHEYRVEGDFLAHSYVITDGRENVAYLSKKYFAWGDTYEIDIRDDENLEFWLFVVIIIDQVLFQNRGGVTSSNFNN